MQFIKLILTLLHLSSLVVLKVKTVISADAYYCKLNNFKCEEPSSFRCGCKWKQQSIRDKVDDNCIPYRWTCDGENDCLDGSDEADCDCEEGFYKCGCDLNDPNCKKGRGCIRLSSVCDGKRDCTDGSDENQCSCKMTEYKCGCPGLMPDCYNSSHVLGCVEKTARCDGCKDCADGSDEKFCTCKYSSDFQCGCNHTAMQCENGTKCISHRRMCNGVKDCNDGSDEIGCSECGVDKFCCDSDCTKCIAQELICNGVADCFDGKDEDSCCTEKTLTCDNRQNVGKRLMPKLIPSSLRCNGENNCDDWSDEVNCTYNDLFKCNCHRGDKIICENTELVAIDKTWVCDGHFDCPDKSDEFQNCTQNFFKCDSGDLVHIDDVCDGDNDCKDWSDERGCNCSVDKFQCACYSGNITCNKFRGCISSKRVCNGYNDCGDWSDEKNCICPKSRPVPCDCYKNNMTCDATSNKGCYRSRQRCDGKSECPDYSDEFTCDCADDEVRCGCILPKPGVCLRQGACIKKEQISDGVNDCWDASDELCNVTIQMCDGQQRKVYVCSSMDSCFYTPECDNATCTMSNSTICQNGDYNDHKSSLVCSSISNVTSKSCETVVQCFNGQAIMASSFCDRKVDCPGDEIVREPGFKCVTQSLFGDCILPQENLYDSVAQCTDKSDLCFQNNSFTCFRCLDGRLIISRSQVCNGIVDCYDLSDECLCEDQTACGEILGKTWQSGQNCSMNEMPCNGTCVSISAVLCNHKIDCSDGIDEKYCDVMGVSDEIFEVITCENKWGQVNARKCNGIPECRNLEDECDSCFPKAAFCNDTCHNLLPIGDRYCNGRADEAYMFLNRTDCEKGFDEKSCPERFYCSGGVPLSVGKTKECNGIKDCLDGSDEHIDTKKCKYRFYCEKSNTTVSIHFTEAGDGKEDCPDGSDECPTAFQANAFSSQKEMISGYPLQIIIWVMATFAISGNIFFIAHTIKQLAFSTNLSALARCNYVLLLNLGLADLLMGVYLLIIAIKSVEYSGKYCEYDKIWRSSFLCASAGSLGIIASEASVLMLVLLTSFRMASVLKPFKTTFTEHLKRYLTLALASWILAILLATIPLFEFISSYFASSVWFPNVILSTDVVTREHLTNLVERLCFFHGNSGFDTSDLLSVLAYLSKRFPDSPPKAVFGYYSDNPVCLPRFFVSHGEAAWEYSVFMITLNFASFIYIAIGYVVLYRKSTAQFISAEAAQQSLALQRKVARLIVTDFACWVPICLMAYIQLVGINLNPIAYVISAVVLLPINSVLNPILYSPVVESAIKKLFCSNNKSSRNDSFKFVTVSNRPDVPNVNNNNEAKSNNAL
ncbi:uncharacterized protein LOC143452620 [Clavelina lepadiformis]|uniref:uncharacterized protein LOC143452620 n=1 Tax=Clavelina lepadiformis TaxID=159417 RepID=UPI004041D5C3